MMSKQKRLGQFFTDPAIAKFMIRLAVTSGSRTFLDPTVGKGVFITEALKANPQLQVSGFEIDKDLLKEARAAGGRIKNEDYLYRDLKRRFDSIVCNPPYNRFQKIPDRKLLIPLFQKKYGVKLSGYTNYYIYFMVKSLSELKKNGKCCYIVPYEFLSCGYGEAVKEYILKQRQLKAIYKLDSGIKLFNGALTTSCILLFENESHEAIEFVDVQSLDELERNTFRSQTSRRYGELRAKEKWSQYFKRTDDRHRNLIQLCEIGRVKRGIATGSNAFFVLNRQKIKELRLSPAVCLPCLTRAQQVRTLKFTSADFEQLANENQKVFLFNGENAARQQDLDYIACGERLGCDKTFLTSHRHPWYAVEKKDPAPILISVFNRNRLKVIKNEARVKSLTAFHSLYLKDPALEDLYFCYLITPTAQKILLENRREYGDGLEKFEPNDLNRSFVLNMDVVSAQDRERVLGLYETLTPDNIDELDSIFAKYL